MLAGIFLLATAAALPNPGQSVESKNTEFLFTQYPPRALAAGEQGSVRFRAEVDEKGNVLSCKVTDGSGHELLDKETCDLIVDHASFRPTLDSEGKARSAIHDGVVNWRIPGAPAPATTPVKIASASGKLPDEVVCRRITRPGSLVAHSRLCLTPRQWVQYSEQNQDRWGEIQGKFGSSNDGQATFPNDLATPGHLSGGYSPPPDKPQ